MATHLKNKTKEAINYQIKKLKPHTDRRGWFVEVLKRNQINEEVQQISVASLKPGAIRGNHYHLKRVEWFFVFGDKAQFYVENTKTHKKRSFKLSLKNPKVIVVFPNTAHAVKNLSKKTIYLLEAQNDIYNPKNPDKYSYIVCKPE